LHVTFDESNTRIHPILPLHPLFERQRNNFGVKTQLPRGNLPSSKFLAIKYTQSNSVGYAKNGMMVGIGAGQQSRVDCVKLAGRKVSTWRLRFHPKVMSLPFKSDVKRQGRVNARVRFIEGDMQATELAEWNKNFDDTSAVAPLSDAEKSEFLAGLDGVALSSDAFFPFRDSIDYAVKYGVKFVAQPGGSNADQEVTDACDTYGMAMAHTGLRLFHH